MLIDSKIDDPLIDIEAKDMLDMIRIYSVYLVDKKPQLHIPELFHQENPEEIMQKISSKPQDLPMVY